MFDPYCPVPSSQFVEDSSEATNVIPDDRTGRFTLVLRSN